MSSAISVFLLHDFDVSDIPLQHITQLGNCVSLLLQDLRCRQLEIRLNKTQLVCNMVNNKFHVLPQEAL
jgi:hypothetical protein